MTKQKPSRKPTKSTKPAKAAKSAPKPAKPAPKAAAKAKAKPAAKSAKAAKPVKAAAKSAKSAKAAKAAKPVKAAAKPTKSAKAVKPVKAAAKSTKPAKAAKPVKAAAKSTKPAKVAKVAKVAAKPAKIAKAEKPAKTAAPARAKRVENGVSKASQLTLALDASNAVAARAVEESQVESDGAHSQDGEESEDSDDEEAAEPLTESPRKIELKALLQASVEQALASARVAHHAAVEGATHEEARPENDKDTRGLEQSYLARGHAQRVAELEAGLASLVEMSVHELGAGAPIALGAIVRIEDVDHERTFLVAPAGGGMVLPGDITVLTPTSPIGRALLGRGVDDECEVGSGAHARTLTILSVE